MGYRLVSLVTTQQYHHLFVISNYHDNCNLRLVLMLYYQSYKFSLPFLYYIEKLTIPTIIDLLSVLILF